MKDRIVIRSAGTTYFLGNKEVSEIEYRKVYPLPTDDGPPTAIGANAKSGYPFKSDALGYHPKQRGEATKHLEKLGVPTEIDPAGRPVIRNAAHYKQLRRALKVHHNNAYDD